MDRNKPASSSRGPKSKITQQPPDLFIALGQKPSSSRDVDPKRPVPLPKATSTSHLQPSTSKGPSDRKREGNSSSLQSGPQTKKLKVNIPGRPTTLTQPGLLGTDRIVTQPSAEPWESLVLECEPQEVFDQILMSAQTGNTDKSVSYILGAIKSLRSQRFKPCKILSNSILLACQCSPSLFTNEHIVAALVSVLRKDAASGLKNPNKSNVFLNTLFINILVHAFSDVSHWPEVFLKLYVEDAMADRVWIDNPYCKPFVDNVITAFNTKQPPKSLLTSETWTPAGRDTSSPLTVNAIDEDEVLGEHRTTVEAWNLRTIPRYTQAQEVVEQIVLEAIKEQLARRQQPETISKNFVRFLSTACGLVEIRVIAVSRIETWLHNHKLMKPAQELLAYLCYNCSAKTQRDLEVVAQLSKLRLKNKPMVAFFNNCLREMVINSSENLYPLLKYTIYNELSNARNSNNLLVVGALFQVAPEASADAFADICLELLLNKDDYLRPLRALLKEINRVLRHEFNLLTLVQALLRDRKEIANLIKDCEFKDRIFLSLADLVCMCMLLCVSPQVRDAASQSKRDVSVLQPFQLQVSNIQREVVTWLHDSALRMFTPSVNDFHHVLHKVVFLEQAESYYKVDSWPGENERNVFLRLASEVPLSQGTLLRLLLIGISKDHPVGANDILEICDQLIRRAANLPQDCLPPLEVDKVEIIDFFFNLCVYNYPENICLPAGYMPPRLAISTLYWKTWMMLLILAAHNPSTIGSVAWSKYPTLRVFMEMCITNHFTFPPPTMSSEIEDYQTKEQQLLTIEKQNILEFETHLAAASTKIEITEHTSLLLPQLIQLRPLGEARRPPQLVLDQLQTLNTTHRLGHLLCRSRHPDFLLNIMSRQGGTAHMPWLAELVHSSEGALAHLPVQCLCEYLLSTAPTEKLTKHSQLLAHLRMVVSGNNPLNACEVLEYLLRRLTSLHAASREQAIKGLTLILAPTEEADSATFNNTAWLTQYLPQFLHINTVRPILVQFLRQALLVETNPVHVSNYINFLAAQSVDDSLPDLLELILDLASLIVERSSVTSYILPGENMETLRSLIAIFYLYLQRTRENSDETIPWSENQDQIFVTWATGEQCTLQVLVVHASIILLTYGQIENFPSFDLLLDLWFPVDMEHPNAYLVDTQEPALLVPDWLKLKMIRSSVPRLVDAAVAKLEASQLVLFIQSFGIPVVSISKLFQILDKVSVVDPRLVVDSVLDKNYMIQLVEVQNRRGAIGGEIFVKALEMANPVIEDDEIKVPLEIKKEIPVPVRKPAVDKYAVLSQNSAVFQGTPGVDVAKSIREICKVISLDAQAADVLVKYLLSLPVLHLAAVVKSNVIFTSLFRLLFAKPTINNNGLLLAESLLPHMENSRIKSILNDFVHKTNPVKMEMEDIDRKLPVKLECEKMDDTVHLGISLGRKLLEHDSEVEKTGMFVDWLSAVELEIVNLKHEKLQMDLLFSRKRLPFCPLLMSLVLQKANWSTLHGIVEFLLDGNIKDRCPTSVLDFLTALTKSPRLWQGRDKGTPKHYHSEDILQLAEKQATVLVQYVLEEATLKDEDWEKTMESRLPLLLNSIRNFSEPSVNFLLSQATGEPKAFLLLLMIYMSIPATGKHLNNMKTEHYTDKITNFTSTGSIDKISHTLLSALTATPRSKDWTKKSQDLDICARKLAATHPDLVLRQLPMLAGSLRGRFQYEPSILKSRGHLMLFGQVLGLLEVLQPKVFLHTEALCNTLDSYFKLLQAHGKSMKELTVIVNRIVIFLQNWMTKDIENALKYLHQYGNILNEIQIAQPGVRPLLSSVSLPTADQVAPSELLVGTATPPAPDPLPQQWPQLVQALQSSDNLTALQDVDHLTSKKPQLLEKISQTLFNSLASPSQAVRSLASLLIVRLLRYNPNISNEALPAVLSCLNSRNPDVISSILDRLPEIVASMQEHAEIILTRVFHLDSNSSVIATSISKTISLLNLQSGC